MNPYKIEAGISYFYLRDVEIYGCPSTYGFSRFHVIDADPIYCYTNYLDNPGYSIKPDRPTHLYDRLLRFRIVVSQLLGYKFSVAKSVQKSERWEKFSKEVSGIMSDYWNECRRILKNHNFSKYYNCIPSIIRQYCYFKDKVHYTETDFQLIMMTFKYIQEKFKTEKDGRVYFPNLRFIALKIMEFHRIPLQYPIPLLITKSKAKFLNDYFDKLVEGLPC